jgi:hypothetical protein
MKIEKEHMILRKIQLEKSLSLLRNQNEAFTEYKLRCWEQEEVNIEY